MSMGLKPPRDQKTRISQTKLPVFTTTQLLQKGSDSFVVQARTFEKFETVKYAQVADNGLVMRTELSCGGGVGRQLKTIRRTLLLQACTFARTVFARQGLKEAAPVVRKKLLAKAYN